MGETINQTVEALEGFICWTIRAFMKVQYGLPRVLGKWDFKGSFEFFFTCSRRARKAETSGCRPRVLVFGGGGFRSSVRHSEFACC